MPEPQVDRRGRLRDRLIVRPDAALEAAVPATAAAGMPPIAVSAPRASCSPSWPASAGAPRVLETGYPGRLQHHLAGPGSPAGGRLISLEVDPRHAEVARANLAAAGVDSIVEVRVGAALDTLPKLVEEGAGPFDLIFIDADKPNIPEYVTWSIKLSGPAPCWWWTTWCVTAGFSMPAAPGPRWWASGASTSSWPRTTASAPPPSRRWDPRATTASPWPS